jgi:hypothetical protein
MPEEPGQAGAHRLRRGQEAILSVTDWENAQLECVRRLCAGSDPLLETLTGPARAEAQQLNLNS